MEINFKLWSFLLIMSVFDYMKELTLFDNYENKVIKMLIDELNLY
jgi:hypothetical protein